MTSMTSRNEMFTAKPRHYLVKNLVIVVMTAGLTFGFILHSLHPTAKSAVKPVPAVCLAQQ
jgi:hypothetical protein